MSNIKFINNFAKVAKELEATNKRNMRDAVVTVYRELMQILSGPRSGRMYFVPGTKKLYQASAGGEAPARRTAALARSYRFEVEPTGLYGVVGTNNKYAADLEYGTSRMEKRPHLSTAFERTADAVKRLLARGPK